MSSLSGLSGIQLYKIKVEFSILLIFFFFVGVMAILPNIYLVNKLYSAGFRGFHCLDYPVNLFSGDRIAVVSEL